MNTVRNTRISFLSDDAIKSISKIGYKIDILEADTVFNILLTKSS